MTQTTFKTVKKDDKPLTAKLLKEQLSGSYKERLEEEKTILLKYKPGQRPEVYFTGFWTGKFVRAAINSISKAYRLRKWRPSRPSGTMPDGTPNPAPNGVGEKKEVK